MIAEVAVDLSGAAPLNLPAARILIVDDQSPNVQVVGSVLGRLGYEIVPASDGPTALKRMMLRVPDLILLDLLMPGMDGCEVCRRIRQNPDWKDIPVIFLSAADDKDLVVRALESGGVDYVTKPFNQGELVSRVRTQLDLKAARDRLRQLAEDKDELLGILAHDLKSHLAGLSASARLMRERTVFVTDERTQHLTENIARTTGQLLSFVEEFLANAAADHGVNPTLVPMDLCAAAAAAVRNYQEGARRKSLKIETDFATEGTMVLADPSAVDQVLDNLLSNAVKFSPPDRLISVAVQALPEAVECRIHDRGPGFTAEDRERMFQRYRRLSARPTGGEPSSGLGLSIVRKLVMAMNGTVSCQSLPGQGATFLVQLPAAPKSV